MDENQISMEEGIGETLRHVEPEDLILGMIPEFISRLPVIASLNELTRDDLVTILTEPKNSVVKQYKALFKMEGVNLEFEQEALKPSLTKRSNEEPAHVA